MNICLEPCAWSSRRLVLGADTEPESHSDQIGPVALAIKALTAIRPLMLAIPRPSLGEIGASIGEGARFTSPRREIRRMGPKQAHTIALRSLTTALSAHTCEFLRVLQRMP